MCGRCLGSAVRGKSRSRVERPHILAENRALAWSVRAFSPKTALSRGASSHSRLKSRSRVERPDILAGNRALAWRFILAGNRALAWSVRAFSPEIALSRGASSHSRRKSRSRVERPRILAGNRALAWSVFAFLLASAVTVELEK